MGVSYYIYIGPYVEVYNPLKPIDQEYHSCPSKGCSNHTKPISDGYCPKCGTKIGRLIRKVNERIHFDVYREFGDGTLRDVHNDFGENNYMRFLDNAHRGLHHLHIDAEYDSVNDFTDKNPSEVVDEYKKLRSKEIARLQEVFGNDNVTVKWGVINYVC